MNILIASLLFVCSTTGVVQQANQPASAQDTRHQGVNDRGDKAMGFSHEKATHHFSLYSDGGAIEVNANEAKDTDTRDQIRSHFGHIAKMFADGDFNMPMLIHGQNPPGAKVMSRLKLQIHYALEETPNGSRLRITSANAEALRGIHEFLRFQIKDHQTGDSMAITKTP